MAIKHSAVAFLVAGAFVMTASICVAGPCDEAEQRAQAAEERAVAAEKRAKTAEANLQSLLKKLEAEAAQKKDSTSKTSDYSRYKKSSGRVWNPF